MATSYANRLIVFGGSDDATEFQAQDALPRETCAKAISIALSFDRERDEQPVAAHPS
jgi:hypothetical protein